MEIFSVLLSSQSIKIAIIFVLAMIIVQIFNVLKNRFIENKPATFFLNKYSFTPKQYFFSYHELEFYRLLSDFLCQNHPGKYSIFPKVRLLDLADTKYKINYNKISSKHIDFLIVDQTKHCSPILAIELNGPSHETKDMHDRDSFVAEFFKLIDINFLIIHNEEIKKTEEIYQKIKDLIKNQKIHIQTNNDLFVSDNLIKLGNVFEVSQGVVEGTDKVNKKNAEKFNLPQGKGIFVVQESEFKNMNLSEDESKFIKKYLDTNDVVKYGIQFSNDFLIYLKRSNCLDINKYPNIRDHLSVFKNIMLERRETKNGSNEWFHLHRPRIEKYFETPKLICKGMFKSPEFTFDDTGYYVGMSFSVIIQKDKNYNLKYLLAILNSKLGEYRFNQNGKKRGVGVDIGVGVFREFPVPISDINQQNPFVEKVDQTLAITSQTGYDPKNPPKEQLDLEREIDQMVYELYGLSEDEIKVVEESLG